MDTRRIIIAWAQAIGIASATCVASAADVAPAPHGRLLTKAELRSCLLRESDLERRRAALEQSQAAHAANGVQLADDAEFLSQTLRSLDATNAAAVASYNRRNAERNRMVEAHNKRAEALNALSADLQAAQADLLSECATGQYLQTDEDALRLELGPERWPKSRGKAGTPGAPRGAV